MFIRLATDWISPDKEKFQLGGNAVAHCIKAVEGDESCISARGKLLCFQKAAKNYAAHAWHHSIHV